MNARTEVRGQAASRIGLCGNRAFHKEGGMGSQVEANTTVPAHSTVTATERDHRIAVANGAWSGAMVG
jgi:hypothetical protein